MPNFLFVNSYERYIDNIPPPGVKPGSINAQQNLSCRKFKKIDPIIVAKTWIESFTS